MDILLLCVILWVGPKVFHMLGCLDKLYHGTFSHHPLRYLPILATMKTVVNMEHEYLYQVLISFLLGPSQENPFRCVLGRPDQKRFYLLMNLRSVFHNGQTGSIFLNSIKIPPIFPMANTGHLCVLISVGWAFTTPWGTVLMTGDQEHVLIPIGEFWA